MTIIDIELLEDEENYQDSDDTDESEDNYESVLEIITNLSNSLKVRLDALEEYYKKEGNNAIEILIEKGLSATPVTIRSILL